MKRIVATALVALVGAACAPVSTKSTAVTAAEGDTKGTAVDFDGRPIPLENGAPLRLVAPDHRGVEWVKWISSIRFD